MLLSDVIDHSQKALFINSSRLFNMFSGEEVKDFRNLLSTPPEERIPENQYDSIDVSRECYPCLR